MTSCRAGLVVVEDAETGSSSSSTPVTRCCAPGSVTAVENGTQPRRGNAPGWRARAPHRHDGGPGHGARRDVGEHQAQAPMTFANPVLLAVGLVVAAALACAAVAAARRRASGARLGRRRRPAAGAPGSAGVWFTIAGIAVLAVATAGPR